MEGSLVAYKVFSNGSVLNASEIQENLMNQSVIVFSNTAARSAALTSPLEGMLTWIEDLNRYEAYNGTTWIRLMPDFVLLSNQSFTTSTSLIIANCFSADYVNYVVQVTTTNSGANARFQLRAGATTQTTGYSGVSVFGNGTSALSSTTPTSSFECFGDSVTANIFRPFLTQTTAFTSLSRSSGNAPGIHSGNNTSTLSFDSLVLNFVTAETGTIRIYGLRG
jgi:hypothetical protein